MMVTMSLKMVMTIMLIMFLMMRSKQNKHDVGDKNYDIDNGIQDGDDNSVDDGVNNSNDSAVKHLAHLSQGVD
eukprot:7793178-Ditylum_brightwellii.AAC.1